MTRSLALMVLGGVVSLSLGWLWMWSPLLYGDKGMMKKEQMVALIRDQEATLDEWHKKRLGIERQVNLLSQDPPDKELLSERVRIMGVRPMVR